MNNNTPLSLFSGNTSDVSNRARVAGQFLVDETLGDSFLDLNSTNNGRLQLKDSTKVPIIGKNNIQLFDEWGDDQVLYRNLNSLNNLNKVSNIFLNGSHRLSSDLYNKEGLYYSIISGYNHQILYDDIAPNKNNVNGSCEILGLFVNGSENTLKNFFVGDTIVNGTSNELNLYVYGSTITGGNNTVAYLLDTVINGANNTITECNNSIINGRGNYSASLCYVENESNTHAKSGGLDTDFIYNNTSILSYPLWSSGNTYPLEFGSSKIDNTIVTGRNNKLYMTKNSLVAGYELLIGNKTYSVSDSLIFGCFNEDITSYSTYYYMHNPKFIMGNGSYDTARSNLAVFQEDYGNNSAGIQFAATINSSGADYAEMFEWKDGNETDESREGLFVTLDGDKIKIANERIFVESDDENYSLREDYNNDTYILGVVSANPAMLGDSYFGDVWKDKFIRDHYGRYVYDGEGKKVLNPEYDPTKVYIDRRRRKEWDAVGLIGKLLVKDDGTCEPKKFCKVGHNGKATKSDDNTGWYVMKRVNENLIQILFK